MSKTPEQLELAQRLADELRRTPAQTPNDLAASLGQPIKAVLAVLNDDSRFVKGAGAKGWTWSLERGGAKADRWRSEPAAAPREQALAAAPVASTAPASRPPTDQQRRAQQEALLAAVDVERLRMGWSRARLADHLDVSGSLWQNFRKYLLSDPIRSKLETWLKTVRQPVSMPPAPVEPSAPPAPAVHPSPSVIPLTLSDEPSSAGFVTMPPPSPVPEAAPPLTKLQSTAVLGDVPLAELLGNADRLNASLVDLGSLASASTVRQLASLVRGMRAVLGA